MGQVNLSFCLSHRRPEWGHNPRCPCKSRYGRATDTLGQFRIGAWEVEFIELRGAVATVVDSCLSQSFITVQEFQPCTGPSNIISTVGSFSDETQQ